MNPDEIVTAIASGYPPDHHVLDALHSVDRIKTIDRLLESPAGRRWLRRYPHRNSDLPDRLLEYEDDFRTTRRDSTLPITIDNASEQALISHASAIAAGPAAADFWARLQTDPDLLTRIARDLVAGADRAPAEATIYLLVLDPLDPYGIGPTCRGAIAAAGLRSPFSSVRGLAAEFLAGHDPAVLLSQFDDLISDEDQRVRGIAWSVALHLARVRARDRAIEILADDAVPIPIRRSALVAIGTSLPTHDVIDILTYLVAHPDPQLASDAADLLYNQHRNPVTAEAARLSPHAHVREIAEALLDPLKGSPAAGGSRPGDPTRSATDIYESMVRQLEEREEQLRRDGGGDGRT